MPDQLTARYRGARRRTPHRPRPRSRGALARARHRPGGTRLVEELTGYDDHRPQAEALARDYAAELDATPRQRTTTITKHTPWAA